MVLKDAAVIAGIGQTDFGKSVDGTEAELACRAITAALEDAGIGAAEVDGLSSYTQEATDEVAIARSIGAGELTWFGQVGYGGGAGCATIGHAAMAIATGQASTVVAWRSRKRGSGGRPWAGTVQLDVPAQWTRPPGVVRPVDEVAMLTRRHMHEFGTTREHLGNVAIAVRGHARSNPVALMGDRPLDMEQYLGSRTVSDPLCLFDNCLETDGAVAAVVVAADRVADCRQPPVYVHAVGQGLPRGHQTMVDYFRDDPFHTPSAVAARSLWRDADVGPGDVDVAQVYDAFTPMVLFALEGYGFCGRGESGPFSEGGTFETGGSLPLNTSGGSLSEAYIHGFNLITEGVRQLRGTSTAQIPNAEVCFVSSGDIVPTSALVLRR